MKKYWIIVNGQPQGPFTPEELKARADFRADLPVWYSGLPEWSTVAGLPELAALLSRPIDVEPIVEEAEAPAPEPTYAWAPSTPRADVATPCPPTYLIWNILITLLCCCGMPAGIIGIVFSSKVNSAYMAGDQEGAQRNSNRAAWCVMIGIVLGLLSLPIQLITTLL